MIKKRFVIAVSAMLGLAASVGAPTGAIADDTFPNKPIRLIVPYSPGGTSDITARLIASEMGTRLGQPVVVENIPGAGSAIGAARVAKSPNDGYTILLATSTTMTSNPLLYKNLQYRVEEFTPVSLLVTQPFVFSVNPRLPAKTLSEFVAYAKKNPGKINYATTGIGSAGHVVGEMVEAAFGIDMVDVPYKGSSPALADLIGGQIQLYFDGITSTLPFYRNGALRVLSATSEERVPAAPDIPTVVEEGYPNLVIYSRYSLQAPAGTPRAVIDRLNKAATSALRSETVRARMTADGNTPHPTTPEGLAEILKADAEVWGRTIRKLGIRLG